MLVSRKNHRFIIDKSLIKAPGRVDEVCTALYAEIYLEFRGASNNPRYCDLNYIDRLQALNSFAEKWLKERGCL